MNPSNLSRLLVGGSAAFGLSIIIFSGCATYDQNTAPAVAPTSAVAPPVVMGRERTLLDADWRFHRGEVADSNALISAGIVDQLWPTVHLPHDYGLDEADYSATNDRSHGYLSFTVGWYRKHFIVPASDQGRILRLDFDGVYRDCEVWLNGTYLGRHQSGFTPFSYDITSLAKPGTENVVTVRVDPRHFEGWWYEGSGIYRHVYLTALNPVHVAQWGTYVESTVPNGEKGADDEGDLTIQTTLENNGPAGTHCTVRSEILGPDGNSLQTASADDAVQAGGRHDVVQHVVVAHPQLWSLESPNLYQLRTTILQDGVSVDSTTTTFGIRTIHYDGAKGFFLNGKRVEIQGVANHQDLSALGIAVPDNVQLWRVAQLQKAGCNAWRTAHNPPNESLLDACDRLGMMVMDENRHLGDTYVHHAQKGTRATDLSDLAAMIQRDRNHPSIIMWSMCNEEPLQSAAEGTNIFAAMMKVVHKYDRSRPITSAMNAGFFTNSIADFEDIVGVNYNATSYDRIHKRRPNKPMFGSEDTNQKTTRGEYEDDRDKAMSSAYNLSAAEWLDVANRPYMCGSFTWTGFDYRGEPNPFGWPDVSNNTGLLDLCGNPKDKFYYFQSCWTTTPMVHLLPDSWNWPSVKGRKIRVIAFSNAKKVELILNGRSLGVVDVEYDSYAQWQVPFEPGHLVAKAYTNGKVVATEDLATTGAPAAIQALPFGSPLAANDEDIAVIPITILDQDGNVVPDSTNEVTCQLLGAGRIVGLGNGDPADHSPEHTDRKRVFHGRCDAYIQAGSTPAIYQLIVRSPGLAPAAVSIRVQ